MELRTLIQLAEQFLEIPVAGLTGGSLEGTPKRRHHTLMVGRDVDPDWLPVQICYLSRHRPR